MILKSRTIQDIVVEFAGRDNQPVLDRYISGEDVPLQHVRPDQARYYKRSLPESPIYAKWLVAIREVGLLSFWGLTTVTKSGDRSRGGNTTTRVESQYRGSTQIVHLIYHRTLDRAARASFNSPHRLRRFCLS